MRVKIEWLAMPLFLLLDPLFVRAARREPGARPLLLVVRLDAIGDYLLWSRAARDLAALYPAARHRRVLLANREWAALARASGVFDEVLEVDRARWLRDPAYRWGRLRAIRALGAAVCVQPTVSREILYGDAAVRASGARERIGSAGDLANQRRWQKRISDRWYTRQVPAAAGAATEIERNVEFVRALGAADARPGLPEPVADADAPPGFDPAPYYALFPGAGSPLRRWPLERFARLAERIHGRTGLRGIVCGGPADAAGAGALVDACGAPLENWAGRTTLAQLARVVRDARLLVTNETSAAHLAAAGGTPAVCVLGGGHFGRFMPYPAAVAEAAPVAVFQRMPCYGCNWRCIYHPRPGAAAPCVTEVTLDAVWAQVEALLARVDARDARRHVP